MSTAQQVAQGGTVFDVGYQRYEGEREGRKRSRTAIYKDGIRIAMGFGRGARAKVLPWVFIGVLAAIALIMAIIAGGIDRYMGDGTARALDLPSHSDFYGMAAMLMFVFAALVGPELLCPDRRDGTINLYLVRPITGSDYVIARWSAFLTVMTLAAWFPQTLLFLGLCLNDPVPLNYLTAHWLDIPNFLVAGFCISVYVTTLALLTASFTTRRAYAAVFLVGLFIISTPITVGMANGVGGTIGEWISMFNLTNIPVHVNDLLFDDISKVTSIAPARNLPGWIRVSWFFGWTIIPGVILWSRYRKLTP
jgi:ABC-2 type transport system permease protein